MTSVEVIGFLLKRLDSLVGRQTDIDDMIFRLHHGWTSPVMFMFVFVCILYRLLEPITCTATSNGISEKMLNAYCLMQNTFILPDEIAKNIGQEVSHQGVDKLVAGQPRSYQKYYQWVPIVLLAQGMLFYATRFFWQKKEKGITRNLLIDLDRQILKVQQGDKLMSEEEVDKRVDTLAGFLFASRGQYRSYFVVYLLCTVANLLNVCLQLVFTDMFLDASFFENGWQVLSLLDANYANRTDSLVTMFPRVAKCQFQQFGVGGNVQTHDILCVLPFNFFYEMIFVYNLVWFTVLAILSFLGVLFWAVNLSWPRARIVFLRVWKRNSDDESLMKVVMKLDVGDWFLLRLLAINMSANHFATLLNKLRRCLNDDIFEPIISTGSKKVDDE